MTTNNDDTKKEVLGIPLKCSKLNSLYDENAIIGISLINTQTNNNDTDNKLNITENFNISEGNVKEDNISLTEQYQKGTLKNGFYYFDNGKNQYIVDYHNIKGFEGLEGVKVIAEVPSYKEWQTTLRHNKALDRDINNIIEMNGALGRKLFAFSELLKEWIHYYPIILYEHEDTLKTKDIIELYERTREVLK